MKQMSIITEYQENQEDNELTSHTSEIGTHEKEEKAWFTIGGNVL